MKHWYPDGFITGFCFIVMVVAVLPSQASAFLPVRDGFIVSGRLYEFEGCVGYQRGWMVMLEPPGLSVITDVASGYFEFTDIPDGEYTLYAIPGCNPFGCWPDTAITVAGADIYVDICPDAVTPTPSQTPTPTPSPNCTPIVCYLVRELPEYACTDDEITVNLVFYGDSFNCSVISVEETVPFGWDVLAPPWDDQTENTYIWNEPIDEYQIRVGGPFLAEFSGSAITWDTCDGTMTKTTQGDMSMWIPLSETSWLNRTLPPTCMPGGSFTVYLSQQGGPALIIQTSETLPDGWMVTEPDDFEQQGSTFTWDRLVPEYTVLVPADTVPGDYDINGYTLSSYICPTDPFEHVITGDNTITVTGFEPTPTQTPTQAPDVFTVSGRLYEFEGCVGYQRGWTMMLEPPGLSAITDVESGYFAFTDIPDGEYTLLAVPDCNPFGCWPETAITVAGGDIYVDICPDANTPTPSQTPTATPSQTPTPTPSPNCTPIVCYLVRELPEHACTDDEITVNLLFYGDSFNCSVISIEETVPEGWDVLAPPWDEQEGNTYIWNEPIDEYQIRVGGAFLAEFSGSAITWDTCDGTMTKTTQGDESMWIPLSETSWLDRTLPPACTPGGSFTVYLSQQGGPAQIILTSETLPDGWMVTEPDDFEQQGSTFTWDRLVPEYTVLIPVDTVPGDYDINGYTLSSYICPTDPFEHVITGDSTVTVTDPEPTPTCTPEATPTPSCPDDICLELHLPATEFGPGSIFYLDLVVMNTGSHRDDAQVFVVLTTGTGDFWFYPDWVRFPPDIDWETADIPSGLNAIWTILPEFTWPHGAGEFSGAMFFAAVLHEGNLVSNLADITFGWME